MITIAHYDACSVAPVLAGVPRGDRVQYFRWASKADSASRWSVLRSGSEFAGMVAIRRRTTPRGGVRILVKNHFVVERFRGRGFGGLLLDNVITMAKAREIGPFVMVAYATRMSVGMYVRRGFTVGKTMKGVGEQGEWETTRVHKVYNGDMV